MARDPNTPAAPATPAGPKPTLTMYATPAPPPAVGPSALITTVDEVVRQMNTLKNVGHVIAPFSRPSMIAKDFAIAVAVVQLDSTVDDRTGNGIDCYRPAFTGGDKASRALNKTGLRRLAQAIGINWLPFPFCRRVDSGHVPHYCEYTAEGRYRQFDGSMQPVRGTAAVDFRDNSDQIGGWTPAKWDALMAANRRTKSKDEQVFQINGWSEQRVRAARQKVLERAETAASSRTVWHFGQTIGSLLRS
jgi:hypothetical protein